MAEPKKRKVKAVVQSPPRASATPKNFVIAMPQKCLRSVAELLGEGFGEDRLQDGRQKYLRLRQLLLDRQVRRMASRFRFKDVTNGPAPQDALQERTPIHRDQHT